MKKNIIKFLRPLRSLNSGGFVIIILTVMGLSLFGAGYYNGYAKAESNAIHQAIDANKRIYEMAETMEILAKEIKSKAHLSNNGLRSFEGL